MLISLLIFLKHYPILFKKLNCLLLHKLLNKEFIEQRICSIHFNSDG